MLVTRSALTHRIATKKPHSCERGIALKRRDSEARRTRTSTAADLWCRDAFENFLQSLADLHCLHDVAISACAAVRSHLDATSNCGQLIKGEFVVGHWFEGVVEVIPPMNTPSLNSKIDSLIYLNQRCDVVH